MYGSELTYSGDPIKRAAYLRIQEEDPEAMARARWSEVDEAVSRCKRVYDDTYEATWEAGRRAAGLAEEMKSGAFREYMVRARQLEEASEEAAMAAALEAASQVRLTSDLDGCLEELRRLNETAGGRAAGA